MNNNVEMVKWFATEEGANYLHIQNLMLFNDHRYYEKFSLWLVDVLNGCGIKTEWDDHYGIYPSGIYEIGNSYILDEYGNWKHLEEYDECGNWILSLNRMMDDTFVERESWKSWSNLFSQGVKLFKL